MYYICTMNYALIDINGHIVMEFHTEDEAMSYSRRLVASAKEHISIYRKVADMKYTEVVETTIYGD